jgi:hypothetical protein
MPEGDDIINGISIVGVKHVSLSPVGSNQGIRKWYLMILRLSRSIKE